MSTPKTSSKNALSHGAYAKEVVFPWEDAQEFDDLHQQLRAEYSVSGRSEEEEVAELAALHWKKRRLHVISQIAARRDAPVDQLVDAGQQEGWAGIIDHIANLPDDLADEIRALFSHQCLMIQTVAGELAKEAEQLKSNAPGNKLESHAKALEKLRALGAPMIPLMRRLETDPLDNQRSPYRASFMEKELKIGAEIDKRIDRVMRRLALIKEHKRLYGSKEISVLQSPPKVLSPPEQIQ